MLGRQDPQMDLADVVLWTGKIDPRPLVERGSFHDRFATLRATILHDEDFEHWFDAEQGRRSIPPSSVVGGVPAGAVGGVQRPGGGAADALRPALEAGAGAGG
jgi:hypothetical protein